MALADAVHAATGESVEPAYVSQGYTGPDPEAAAAERGIAPDVVRLPEAIRGSVLLPGRRAVERSSAWASRFRRLARAQGRLPETVAGLRFAAFACRMARRLITFAAQGA